MNRKQKLQMLKDLQEGKLDLVDFMPSSYTRIVYKPGECFELFQRLFSERNLQGSGSFIDDLTGPLRARRRENRKVQIFKIGDQIIEFH